MGSAAAGAVSVSWCARFLTLRGGIFGLERSPLRISNLFLRDNCLGEESFSHRTKQRLHATQSIDPHVRPESAEIVPGEDAVGPVLHVRWSDRQCSQYPLQWIAENLDDQRPRQVLQPVLWDRETIQRALPTVQFQDVMHTDQGLGDFYSGIITYGLCMVRGCPVHFTASESIAERVGSIMSNREYFDSGSRHYVISNVNNHDDFDIAYTDKYLPLHTDNPDLDQPGGLVTVQPVVQAEQGGRSTFADGLRVAQTLRDRHPDHFKILSTWPVNHVHHQYHHIAPIIEMDPADRDRVYRLRFAEPNRAQWQPAIPQHHMPQFYAALASFTSTMNDPDNVYSQLLPPDTMAVFDNWRLLHGRTAFTGVRKLVGCYIPRDDWVAKARAFGVAI